MKSNFKIHSGFLYCFLLIALCLLPMVTSAQIIIETKGDDTPIRIFGKETIKVFGGMKHNQVDNNDPKKAKLLFTSTGSQLILIDTLYNASGNPIFLKTNDGQDSSKVIFQSLSNNKNYILGDSINFYQMAVDLADYDHEVILGEHVFLRDTLTMQLGNINLNGQELFLIPEESDDFSLLNQRQPYIINEYYDSYIWDTLSGAINLDICVPQNEINNASYNFGGMGIELQNTNNSLNGDVVQFKRRHNLFAIDTFESLRRQYHIDNVDDTDIFNQTFNYMNHEVTSSNFDNIQNLILYRSRNNGVSWDPLFRDTFGENPINNYNPFVHKDELDSLAGIWSLSPCPNPPSIATLPDTTIVICALDTIWLNAGPNVSVLWSDGSTQNPYPFVAPEIYDNEIDYYDDLFVEITDDRGCYNEWYGLVEIHYSPLADLIISSQYTDCEDPIELVTITAEMDELFDYDYLWHDGSSNQTFQYPLSPVGDSTYWVTATYVGSQLTCSSTDSIDVSIYPSAAVDLPDTLAYSCDGSSIILDAGTYAPGATYEWFESNEPSIPIAGADSSAYEVPPFIGENNFVVTVSFDGFCFAFSDQDVSMTNIQLNSNHTDIDCFGDNNGLITTNITGSYPDHIAYFNGVDTDGIETFPGLSPGTYILEVEDSYCSLIDSIEITEPIAPITGTLTPTDIACASSGQIDFAPAGGTPPYTFLWTDGETTEDLTNLTQGGDYTVTLTDANACTFVQTITVNNFGALTTDLEINEISCFGETDGQLEITINTGTPPFSYSWNNTETTQIISNLGVGSYSVTITDANDCTSLQSYDLQNPPEVLANYQQQNILCTGETNGSLTAQNLGGTGPFTFIWNTGGTTQNLDNLSAGDYNVTITDSNNCTGTGNFNITEPAVLAGNITTNDIDCNNPGQINLTPSGGNPPYTFLWNNAETTEDIIVNIAGVYSVTITDTNDCTATASEEIFNNGNLSASESNIQNVSCNGHSDGTFTAIASGGLEPYTYDIGNGPVNTSTFTGLTAGTYNTTITDINGCIGNLEITLDEPTAIEIDITSMDAGCGQNNGSAIATASGGTGALSFLWPGGSTNPDISNLATDSYILTVTDASGCTNTAIAIIGNDTGPILDNNPTIINVACNGENTGAITVNATNGTGTLTYIWSTGANGTNINNLAAGDYVVTVSDANNCQDISIITVNQPEVITSILIGQNIDCNNTGQLNLTPSGGNAPYTFLWSNGETTEDISVNIAGVYSVTITDTNTCTTTTSEEIFNTGNLSLSESNIQNISCNGDSDGAFTVTVTGGVGPYSYDIGNGTVNTATFTGLMAGTYNTTVTDINGCIGNLETALDEPTAIEIEITSTDAGCGLSNGSAMATASGGTGALSYLWPDGSTNPNISNLAADSYLLTVTDASGCAHTATASIGNSNGPVLDNNPTITNVTCNGENTGAITVNATGGTGALTYTWSNNDNGTSISNLAAGDYIVTVSDANNCQDITSITLSQPEVLTSILIGQNIDCNNTGQLNLTPSGGNAPYTFLWSNGDTTEDISVSVAGVYSVTVTDTNTCTTTTSEEVFNTGNLSVSESNPQNISCNGDSDGAFTVTVSGGMGPYSYDIGNGAVNTATFTGLAAGTYNTTVTDVNGCIGNLETTLDEPIVIEIDITSTDAGCGQSNGTATATASGGIGALSYLWPDGSTDPNISNLAADNYILTVTDASGCTNTALASIGNSNGPMLDSNPTITNVTCNGENTGTITVNAAGGTGTLTYTWSNSDNGASINNLAAGDYILTVSDTNNCQDIATITVSQPEAIATNVTVQNIDCNNPTGTASANPSGGTGSYSYLWSTGSTDMAIVDLIAGFYTVTLSDVNNCTNTETVEIISNGIGISVSNTVTDVNCNGMMTGSIALTVNTGGSYIVNWSTGQIGETIDNLAAGNYIATVTSGPCMEIVEVMINEPDVIIIGSTVNNISCSGTDNGSIDLTISGGTGAYTFAWDNGETTEDLSNLAAGDYIVTVMDANNCSETANFNIGSSSNLNVNVTGMDLSCFEQNDGATTANVFGGLPPYTYNWSNGGSTETISDLPIGSYEVTATDASGCEGISSVTLTQPAIINFSFSFTELNCFGDTDGAITVNSNGGPQAIHQYNWSTGQVGATIGNLTGGDYTVTITSGSCSQPELVTLSEPDQIFAEYSATDVDCFGGNDGAIDLTVFGGIAPLTFNWDNGSTTEDLSDLTAAFYNLTITDNDGCTAEQMTVVDEPDLIEITESRQLAGCKVENDGWISLDVTGGIPNYLFAWSNGSSTQVINNLNGGIYVVTVTDQNDCTIERSFELEESPEPFEAYFLAATPVNYGDTIQFVDVSFPKPNSWNWSFDDQDNSMATEANPEFFYPQNINNEISYYDVELIASTDFCTDTIVKEITVHNFRNNISEADTTIVDGKYFEYFNVYPNPTNGLVMLDMKLKQTGDVKLHLTDTSGKRIRKYKLEGSDEYFQHFDLGQLAGGVYILTAKYKKDRRSVKLIVVDKR